MAEVDTLTVDWDLMFASMDNERESEAMEREAEKAKKAR